MVSRSRIPPPSWIGSLPPTASVIALIAGSFLGRPAAAPLRSTMCSRRAPSFSHCAAIAAGSSENTVALCMAPCLRRTHLPSLRSMAGMISMGLRGTLLERPRRGRLPCQKIGVQPQARLAAALRVELHSKQVAARRCAGKRQPVHAFARRQLACAGLRVVAVHEIEARALRDTVPQGVPRRLAHLVPAHVRNLELCPLRVHHPRRGEPPHPPRQHSQPRSIALL